MFKITDIQVGSKLRCTGSYTQSIGSSKNWAKRAGFSKGDIVTVDFIRNEVFTLSEKPLPAPYTYYPSGGMFELVEKEPVCDNCIHSAKHNNTCRVISGPCYSSSGRQNWAPLIGETITRDIVIGDKILIKKVSSPGTVILGKTYVVKDCSSRWNQGNTSQFQVEGETGNWWVWKKDIELLLETNCANCAYKDTSSLKYPCKTCHSSKGHQNWQKYMQPVIKYNVGDTLEVLTSTDPYKQGEKYTIKEHVTDYGRSIDYYMFNDYMRVTGDFLANYFKLVENTPSFKVGDKVVCLEEEDCDDLVKGRIYIVDNIDSGSSLVKLCNQPFWLFDKKRFKLCTEKDNKTVTEFIEGKYYRWLGDNNRPDWFSINGDMDSILDGKPRKCIKGYLRRALFEGQKGHLCVDDMWNYIEGMDMFEEVEKPESMYTLNYLATSDTDWTVKTTPSIKEGYAINYSTGNYNVNPFLGTITDVKYNVPEGYTLSLTDDNPFNFGKVKNKERRGGFMNFLKSFIPNNFKKQEEYGVFDSYGNLDYNNKLVTKRLHALISDGLDEDIKALEEEKAKKKK